jgi:hypothetical protein
MFDYRRLAVYLALAAATLLDGQPRPPNYQFHDSRMFGPPAPGGQVERLSERSATPAAAEPETIARTYLEDYRDRLGIDSTAFFSLPLEGRYESPAAGLTHLVFRRRHAGIAVFGGEVLVHLTREGRVLEVHPGTPWPDGARPSLSVALTAAEAATAALRELTGAAPDASTLREPVQARLVWFPRAADAVAAWELYLHSDSSHWYCVVIDASSGELLFSHNLYRDDRPRGSVFRAPDTPHPNAGAPSLENFTGWPASSGDCPAAMYPAQFRSGPLLQRCWVSATETAGNNAVACLDADGNNQCDWRAADAQAHFAFPFTNSYAASGDAAPDRPAAVTNLFYWSNVLHDWLYGLGFDEAAGNFQADNFGRGGFGGDAVQADAQDGGAVNTANFATPPDGSAPRLQASLFQASGNFLRRDAAFDGDVISHEYVHGLTLRLVGGPFNTNSLALWQSGALAEGWSDAYAASFTNDPVIGEYLSTTPSTGLRSVAYHASSHTFGRFGTLYRRNVGPLNLIIDLPQVHRDGEIWATVLWDLRTALGQAAFEPLVTTALKLTPARPSMIEARDALLRAAQAMGINSCAVWTVFAARGFGASAALNHVQAGLARDTALSVYEAFDTPSACGGSPPQAGAALFSDDVEGGPGAWSATGLWHVTTRRAAAGLRSWWYGQETTANYATGGRTTGSLTSAPINLTGVPKAALEWDQLFLGEGFGRNYPLGATGSDPYLNYDSGWVLVSRDDGATWETLTTLAHNSTGTTWDHHQIDLSRLAGGVIRIRFLFDSLDGNNNAAEGWYLDNIRVSPLSTGALSLQVSPSALSFSAIAGGASPPPQILTVSSSGNWTASVSGGGWLLVSPSSGAVTVLVNSASLPAGTYNAAVTVTAPGASGSPAVIPVTLTVSGPVAQWRWEEPGAGSGVTAADASGNGHAASTAGYGTVAVAGASGRARLFNGASDWAEVPGSPALTPPSFTFSAWINLLSYPAGFGVVASNYGGNYQGWYVAIHSSGRVILSVAGLPASAPWLVSNGTLPLGRWRRLAVTYDGPTRQGTIYLDGVLDVQAAFPAFTPQFALPLTFGRASWFAGYFLHAALDEVSLYPLRLSPSQVLAEYQAWPAPPAPDVNLGIPAEWRLDDSGATLSDASGNGRAATALGAATTAGVRNQARLFNGLTDQARAPVSEAFSPASLTVRAWVRLEAYPNGWAVVLSNYGGNYQGWYLGVHASGRLIWSVASLPASSPWLLSGSALSLHRWYHVAATYHAATRLAAIYLDGALDAQAALAGFTPNTTADLSLGRASWYNGYYLNAAIDEVRIEAAARTPGEILADFQVFPPPPAPAPVAEWRLDDLGPSLADSSGNGRNAIAHGTVSIAGKRNAARRFNGTSDWAEVPAAAALSPASFTLRFWIRLNTLPTGWGVVTSNYGGNYQGWYVGIHATGRVIFSVATPSSSPWLVSNTALPTGAWRHVTVTYDAASRAGTIYVNGARDIDAVFPGLTAQSSLPLTLGRASWYDGYYLAVDLDEVRLLDYRQTGAEVLADASAP